MSSNYAENFADPDYADPPAYVAPSAALGDDASARDRSEEATVDQSDEWAVERADQPEKWTNDAGASADRPYGRADGTRTDSPEGISPRSVTRPRGTPPGRLTATGAGVGLVVGSSIAAVLDAAISPHLGLLFWFGYLVAGVVVAGRIAWSERWAALVLPPLTFVAAAGIASQFAPVASGGWLDRTSNDMLTAVVSGWLPLFLAVLLGAAVLIRRRSVG